MQALTVADPTRLSRQLVAQHQKVDSGNKESSTDTARPYSLRPSAYHHRVLILHTLSESQSQVADSLSNALHHNSLVISEGVVLRGYSGMVDHRPCVGCQAAHRASQVRVDFHDLFDGRGF